MATTFNWQVTAMDCSTTEQNPHTVIACHWTCSGTDGIYNASVYSTCSVLSLKDTFTPYDNLTQEQVLGWIWANGVDKDSIEATVQRQIDSQINPPVVTLPLPWSTDNKV
jgi:hypothetical protein